MQIMRMWNWEGMYKFLNSILLDITMLYILSQHNCVARGIKQTYKSVGL